MTSTGFEPPEGGEPTRPEHDPDGTEAAQRPVAPQQWAWARPQQVLRTVETEPLEYHRLLRGTARYRWYKPLFLLLLSGVYFGVFSVILGLVFVPILMFFDPEYAPGVVAGTVPVLDTQRPVSVLLSLLSIIAMMPAAILAMLTLGMRPVGRIWSVAVRIRWGLLMRLIGVSVLALAVMQAVGIAAEYALQPSLLSTPAADAGQAGDFSVRAAVISAVFVLLLVPLQATAEEVVFRGLFMQVLGSWLKNPWFAIVLPAVLFMLGHIYDVWGLAVVGLLGIASGWLTWRTGGLEAGIAIHIVNNLVGFGFLVSGLGGSTAQTESGSGPGGVIGQIAGLALYIWLTLKVFRRGGHGRTRIDLQAVPVAVQAGAVTAGGAPQDAPQPIGSEPLVGSAQADSTGRAASTEPTESTELIEPTVPTGLTEPTGSTELTEPTEPTEPSGPTETIELSRSGETAGPTEDAAGREDGPRRDG